MTRQLTYLLVAMLGLVACAEDEPPARSVNQFVEDPILLEAAVVRCSRDRAKSRYDQECINAREAVNIVAAREEEIRRAFLNLFNNAMEAMDGQGSIFVTLELDDADPPMARIAVRDTGPGIPAEDRPHLFEPYFSTRSGGTWRMRSSDGTAKPSAMLIPKAMPTHSGRRSGAGMD